MGARPEFEPPFEVVEPARSRAPLIFNSPAFGLALSPALSRRLAARPADAAPLRGRVRRRIVPALRRARRAAAARAFPARLSRRQPRAFELDPQMFDGRLPEFANTRSLRVAAGLGAIPRVVGDAQPIYRDADSGRRRRWRGSRVSSSLSRSVCGELLERARARIRARDPDRLPFHALDPGRGAARSTSCSATDTGSSAAGWMVDALEARCARAAIACAATSPMPAASSPSITARRPRPPRRADRDQPRALYGRARDARNCRRRRRSPRRCSRRPRRWGAVRERIRRRSGWRPNEAGGAAHARPRNAAPEKRRPPCRRRPQV